MKVFNIKIDGKDYEYIDSKNIDGVDYVLYADESNIYISQYEIVNNQILLKEVNEDVLPKLKEAFEIE